VGHLTQEISDENLDECQKLRSIRGHLFYSLFVKGAQRLQGRRQSLLPPLRFKQRRKPLVLCSGEKKTQTTSRLMKGIEKLKIEPIPAISKQVYSHKKTLPELFE
jgi:hypothetical protein